MAENNVVAAAEDLRAAIEETRPFSGWAMNSEAAATLGQAARALLDALKMEGGDEIDDYYGGEE